MPSITPSIGAMGGGGSVEFGPQGEIRAGGYKRDPLNGMEARGDLTEVS